MRGVYGGSFSNISLASALKSHSLIPQLQATDFSIYPAIYPALGFLQSFSTKTYSPIPQFPLPYGIKNRFWMPPLVDGSCWMYSMCVLHSHSEINSVGGGVSTGSPPHVLRDSEFRLTKLSLTYLLFTFLSFNCGLLQVGYRLTLCISAAIDNNIILFIPFIVLYLQTNCSLFGSSIKVEFIQKNNNTILS